MRGPCSATGHVWSCSLSDSMSHSAHSVTWIDLSGKQDVRKANSDEGAFIGKKIKKRNWKICFSCPDVKFSTTCSLAMKAKENGCLNKRSSWIMQRGGKRHMVSREHLRLDVTQGLLNLSEPQGNPLRKWALSVLLLQLAVKDISSRRNLNHCHRFICRGSVLKSKILTSTTQGGFADVKLWDVLMRSSLWTELLHSSLIWLHKHRLRR